MKYVTLRVAQASLGKINAHEPGYNLDGALELQRKRAVEGVLVPMDEVKKLRKMAWDWYEQGRNPLSAAVLEVFAEVVAKCE